VHAWRAISRGRLLVHDVLTNRGTGDESVCLADMNEYDDQRRKHCRQRYYSSPLGNSKVEDYILSICIRADTSELHPPQGFVEPTHFQLGT
jgi:hypothetical protein